MRNTKILPIFLAVVALVGGQETGVMSAEGDSALTGKVTSQADGPMEGVLVGAKKAGSTIATWVVSDAQGEYRFPRDRMTAGRYVISIRAVGYELPRTTVEVTEEPVRHDLQLTKLTRPSAIVAQMSNTEIIHSAPGTPAQKRGLAGCVNCHTLQRVLFSRFDPLEMTAVIQRMSRHSNNSSTLHPWMRELTAKLPPPPTVPSANATYLASINLSTRDTFEFPLKTLPRPTGKATQVIYTVYDLPRPDASPHDEVFDREGNLWYSDFNSQYFGKLNLKTGEVVDYEVPQYRLGQVAQGGLQIDIDRDGRIYFGNMFQMQLVRFDPKTQKMEQFKHPMPESTYGDGHVTMIDPAFSHVDGKLWLNIAYDTGTAGGTWQIDLATKKWTQVTYPAGSPSADAYDIVADSKNNITGMGMTNDRLWMTDSKTLKTVWYDMPTKDGFGCRRGHIDSQDRVWCAVFHGNRLVMFDTKTKKITEWEMPIEWTRPYDAQFDDKRYVWTAGMDSDMAVRLNTETGEFTQYLLPGRTNVRHIEVMKSGPLSSMWLGDQHGNTIIRIEPLAP